MIGIIYQFVINLFLYQHVHTLPIPFQAHINLTRTVQKTVQKKEDEALQLRNQAVDLEYDLINETLIGDQPEPTTQTLSEIENLHTKSKELVRLTVET